MTLPAHATLPTRTYMTMSMNMNMNMEIVSDLLSPVNVLLAVLIVVLVRRIIAPTPDYSNTVVLDAPKTMVWLSLSDI